MQLRSTIWLSFHLQQKIQARWVVVSMWRKLIAEALMTNWWKPGAVALKICTHSTWMWIAKMSWKSWWNQQRLSVRCERIQLFTHFYRDFNFAVDIKKQVGVMMNTPPNNVFLFGWRQEPSDDKKRLGELDCRPHNLLDAVILETPPLTMGMGISFGSNER